MKPSVTLELITPEWAIAVLEKAEDQLARGEYHQRPFNEATAQSYAVAMQNGHWLVNDTGIMFDLKGHLIDGRHRLWGIVMSGCSVEMWVFHHCTDKEVNGLLIRVMDTVDVGRPRTTAQQLAVDGIGNSNRVSASCRSIARISCGFPSRLKVTVIQTRQIHEIYGPALAKVMDALHNSTRYMASYLLGPLAMYRTYNSGSADDFCGQYFSMQNLEPGSAVIALQRYLANNPTSSGAQSDYMIRAVCLALHHFEKGIKVTSLRSTDIGSQWLAEKQKGNVAKIRTLLGLDFHDHRTP